LDYYRRIVRECETQGIDIILVTLPRMEKFTYAEHLGIQQFADQYGLRYIDYNMPDLIAALNILPESDYQNSTHLNVFGSQKISLDFSEILKTYDFSDKRADPAYQKWNEDLGVFNQDINS
jgi:hypothetical protein